MSPILVTRRQLALGTVAAALGGPALLALLTEQAAAQGATPPAGSAFADLGLPTLDITATASGYEGVPSELAAGRYLVTLTVDSSADYGAVDFIQPPGNSSVDELLAIIGGFAQMEASPAAMEMNGTPPAGGEEEGGAPPPVIYRSIFAGGIGGPGGTTQQVVLDLLPGDWIVWGDDPSASQQPTTFTATGEMPAELPEPQSDVTATLIDFEISIDGNLTPGDHVLKVANDGAEPHFVYIAKVPDGTTNDQIAQLLMLPEDAAPPAGLPNPEDFEDVISTDTISIGMAMWTPLTVDTGTYVAVCFFPTAGTGLPHAMKGMHTVFTVAG